MKPGTYKQNKEGNWIGPNGYEYVRRISAYGDEDFLPTSEMRDFDYEAEMQIGEDDDF